MTSVNAYRAPVLAGWQQFFSRKADFLGNTAFSNSFWRIAVLAAAGLIGAASHAEAATSIYWPDSDAGISRPPSSGPQPRHKTRRHPGSKENAAKESTKPQGPLILAISIERQSLKVYDANGFFAQTPISTGMRGHATPMGVFSIIQKQKFHRSNIYSGAPMPFMQRITWSGVAMHAGVLPGYPASHGCIRMPMGFAVKMYGWTRMGARVVVTPGEMTPSSFSHPLLTAQKPAPTPVASAEKAVPTATKSDKAAVADAAVIPATSQPTIPREQAQTADASSTLPPSGTSATMSDAAQSASVPEAVAKTNDAKTSDAMSVEAKPEGIAKTAETASSEDKPVEARPDNDTVSTEPAISARANDTEKNDTAKSATPATETVKTEATRADPPKPAEKSDDKAKAAADAGATVPDANKDQARPSDPDKVAASKSSATVAPKRTGQIAVFISRKDNKIYVRQNFAPLFEAPVTIAASDRPLGTHVFTAQADKDDPKSFHWSVVTLPTARHAERRDDDERVSRRRKTVGAVEMKPAPVPDSPAEALDRISIPEDVMARITDALTTGGSIIVSDQGITAGETGEGTDFIVSLR
jgi:L,D-transpeptidase-like protein